MGILSLIVFSPLLGAIFLMMMSREQVAALQRAAITFSLLPFVASLYMLYLFSPESSEFQFVETLRWIPAFGISYKLGVDGISLFLVMLTTFLMPIVILAGWDVTRRVKEYFVLLLILEFSMIGALLAIDLFLFYVFWELMLIPMYFLIGVWGGEGRRYAAIKLVLYTMAGSLLMLVAILWVAWAGQQQSGEFSFDIQRLYDLNVPVEAQYWLFAAFALAFAIKVPMFPLHTWLPDAHTEAPTGGSVILAGVLLKMGGYGFLRFAFPLFPQATEAALPWIAGLSTVAIVYGALVCMVQPDMKRLIAYSSVSHLGFVMLGISAFNLQSVQGGIYQMLSHGISTGGLFLAVGVIYERRHTRLIRDFGGLWNALPVYGAVFLVVLLSSIGLPGLNGFVGEFMILIGAFGVYPIATTIATSGVILGAVYLLWMYQRVMLGPLENPKNEGLADLSMREIAVFVPILALIFVMGLYPKPFLDRIEPTVENYLDVVQGKMKVTTADEKSSFVAAAGHLPNRKVVEN